MPVHIFITIKTAVTKQQLRHLYTCFNRSNKPASDLTEDKRLHRQNQVNVTEERAEHSAINGRDPIVLPSRLRVRAVHTSPNCT